ncbi:MAG TPA: PAS domain-containing protein [Rhizomicrobium sp.]|nr:PAS domain-containing protein [Rhizomicrobium sp.]
MTEPVEQFDFLAGGGEMGALSRAFDWSKTPIGGPAGWPQSLRTAVRILLSTSHPMVIWWGPELIQFYNDAYRQTMGPERHPSALGQRGRDCWAEIWPIIGPQIDYVMAGKGATWHVDQLVPVTRHGGLQQVWWTYGFGPIDSADGVGGVLVICNDVTEEHETREALRQARDTLAAERQAVIAANERLVAESGFLRELFQQAPSFVAVVRGPEHVFELTNAAYVKLIGHRDVVGKTVRAALPELEGQGFYELLDQVYRSGEPFVGRQIAAALQSAPDGPIERRLLDFVYQPIRDGQGAVRGIFVEGTDITQSALSERALRESENQFRSLLEAMPNHVWTARADGELDWLNERTYDYSGLARSSRDWTQIVHPDDLPTTVQRWAHAIASGETYETEFRLRRADGVYRWHIARAVPIRDLSGAVARWIGTNTEIEDQKIATQALAQLNATLEQHVEKRTAELQANEARLRSIFETTYQFQGLMDLRGTLLDANATSLAAIEARLEDVVGRPFWDTPWFTGTPGMPELVKAAIPLVASGQEVRREIVVNLPTGTRAFDFALRPVVNSAGETIAIVPEAIELTERRAAEEALRQSQKMEAIGQLTGGIAHDFNNLLQGIMGALDRVQKRIAEGRIADVDRFLRGAMASAERAAALTHRLLAFSRRQPVDPRPVDLNQLIGSVEELLRRTIGEAIDLDIKSRADLWLTRCDHNQLENALLNLTINARDAMPDGGRLTLETANADQNAAAALRNDIKPGAYVRLSVRDSGVGMAPDVKARAFDPFYTTKPIGQGTGLGLSMIYGFVRQSDGAVRIDSEVGRGTTVEILLPRYGGPLDDAPSIAPVAELQRPGTDEVVLVVEDEAVVRLLIVEVLNDLGYRALEAADGPSALRILQSQQRIDLLVSDIGLPGLNGRQLADAARATRPDLKVLFMTGYAENAAGSAFLEPGMAIIAKPVMMDVLAARIVGMIAGKTTAPN